jgi:predicted nucleic acid-binding protein
VKSCPRRRSRASSSRSVRVASGDEADTLARRYGSSHSGIDAVDYCVAASARVHGLDLWTLNVRDFPMFPNLEPPW